MILDLSNPLPNENGSGLFRQIIYGDKKCPFFNPIPFSEHVPIF